METLKLASKQLAINFENKDADVIMNGVRCVCIITQQASAEQQAVFWKENSLNHMKDYKVAYSNWDDVCIFICLIVNHLN